MTTKQIAGGTVHELPADLREALAASPAARELWEGLTPLARNEWICWTTSVKQPKTREQHVGRVVTQLQRGARRPCCWMGCIHRTDKAVSPAVRGILSKRSRSK